VVPDHVAHSVLSSVPFKHVNHRHEGITVPTRVVRGGSNSRHPILFMTSRRNRSQQHVRTITRSSSVRYACEQALLEALTCDVTASKAVDTDSSNTDWSALRIFIAPSACPLDFQGLVFHPFTTPR